MNLAFCQLLVQRIASPLAAQNDLLDDVVDLGRVVDDGVDLHQKLLPDNHRFRLRMVDICRNDGVTGGYFLADELGCDERFEPERFDLLILSDGYIFHLGCDDASFGVEHLGDVFAFAGALWKMLDRKIIFVGHISLTAHVFG